MSQISREQFLKLVAAGGASFLGLKASAQDTQPAIQPPVSPNSPDVPSDVPFLNPPPNSNPAMGNASPDLPPQQKQPMNDYTGNTGVNQGFLTQQQAAPRPDIRRGPLVPWARLKFIGEEGDDQDWHVHPHGDLNLIDSIRDQTSLNIEKKWCIAEISDLKSMVQYPFLFMHGEISPILTDDHRNNLREYLLRGGFLFAEDCVCGYEHHGHNKETNDFFFRGMHPVLESLLPGATFEKLSIDHPIFHCFYHIEKWPHMQGVEAHGPWGLTYKKRLVALLSPSDLHCGWTNGDEWFGEAQRIAAMEMGTNIYLYAMTQTV